jgi:hypothetical protein
VVKASPEPFKVTRSMILRSPRISRASAWPMKSFRMVRVDSWMSLASVTVKAGRMRLKALLLG